MAKEKIIKPMHEVAYGDTVSIESMQQIADMSPEQFAQFHKDLKSWHSIMSEVKNKNAIARKLAKELAGVELEKDIIIVDMSYMNWVYDDLGMGKVTVQPVDADFKPMAGLPVAEVNIKFNQSEGD